MVSWSSVSKKRTLGCCVRDAPAATVGSKTAAMLSRMIRDVLDWGMSEVGTQGSARSAWIPLKLNCKTLTLWATATGTGT